MLARAIAGEAGVPFYYSSGSEFEEMFVGVGAKVCRGETARDRAAIRDKAAREEALLEVVGKCVEVRLVVE